MNIERALVLPGVRPRVGKPHPWRQRAAHRIARFGVRLPLPLLWLLNNLLCQWLVPRLRGRKRCPTIYGFDLVVRAATGSQYHRNGFDEQGTMHVIAACLRPGDVFVDVGARVGQMAFHAAQLVGARGRVLAFEPAPDRYEDLVDGVAVNDFDNVTTLVSGIERLDDVIERRRNNAVRFLKIGIEGFEPVVLRGATRLIQSSEPPILCYEHGMYRHATPIAALLPAGYALYQLAGSAQRISKLVPVGRRLRADTVFAIHEATLPSLPAALFAQVAAGCSEDVRPKAR